MLEVIGVVSALLLVAVVPALVSWLVIDGLRTGIVRGKGVPMPRTEYPVAYWVVIALYVAVVAIWMRFFVSVALDVYRNGWN